MSTTWIIVIGLLVLAVGGGIVYFRKRQKDLDYLFTQVSEAARPVPSNKKHSFLLFMFKESAKAAKAKKNTLAGRSNDPKYLEVQLIQMGSILKDRSKVTDKRMKQALQLYDGYLEWEKSKANKAGGKA